METQECFGTFIFRFDLTDVAMAAAAHGYAEVARALRLIKSDVIRCRTNVPYNWNLPQVG